MLISSPTSCCPNGQQAAGGMPIYSVSEVMIPPNLEANSATQPTNSPSFFYDLSLLSDKVQQVQSLASIFLTPDNNPQPEAAAVAVQEMGNLIQEIIITASSMMFACQQMSIGLTSTNGQADDNDVSGGKRVADDHRVHGSYYSESDHLGGVMDQWCVESYNNCNSNDIDGSGVDVVSHSNEVCGRNLAQKTEMTQGSKGIGIKNCDIIELEATDLLAKYTHYCHVCGKGFKRDANLRMHMRAHGEEYKSSAALCNPMKNIHPDATSGGGNNCTSSSSMRLPKKYSCPQDGCRWNKNHSKFQPLKSMICVKNHYKRSHCPKMYVCKRCHKKNFSVLSDLRTHEKHCGDLKWQCSCGTTFSRKDKLMGHVALFVGHAPAVNSMTRNGLEARS